MSIKPGETVVGLRTIYFPIFTSDGLLATGGADGNYEGAAISGATVEYQHNRDGWVAAAGAFSPGSAGGEASYAYSAGETAVGLAKGTLAVRVSKAGFRTQTVRTVFGDGIQPGETVDDNRRIYFPMFTDAGYVVSGGTDALYEVDGTFVADLLAHAVVEYQHDRDGWIAADNALVHENGDEWSYTFSSGEVGAGLSRGTVSIRITATGALLDENGNPVVYRSTVVRATLGVLSRESPVLALPPPPPPPVGTNVEAFQRMMLALLPPGKVWRA